MSVIEEQLQSVKSQIIKSTLNGENSFLIHTHTAELLAEGFQELWAINKEDREHAAYKFKKATERHMESSAKIKAENEILKSINKDLTRQNRQLRAKLANSGGLE